MRFRNALARLEDIIDRFGDRQRASCRQLCLEISSFEELHDEEGLAGLQDTRVGHACDVVTRQLRSDLGLTVKTFEDLAGPGDLALQDLDGDALSEGEVLGLNHDAHATLTEKSLDAVLTAEDDAGL